MLCGTIRSLENFPTDKTGVAIREMIKVLRKKNMIKLPILHRTDDFPDLWVW
jgi:hypothetical protein